MGTLSKSLDKDDDVLTIGLNRAVALLADAKPRSVVLGEHPKDGVPVEIRRGRFGPYAQHGQIVASLPRNVQAEDFTLEQAVALLAEKGKPLPAKGGKGGAKGKAKAGAKKAAAKPAAGDAAPAKKATAGRRK